MIRYAARAVPWPEVAGATVLLGVGLGVLLTWPSMWRSLWLPVLALVAMAAWAMDEPAAAVVDATPRPLRWRTLARLTAVLPAGALWIAFSVHEGGLAAPHPASGQTGVLLLIGGGGLALGAAVATTLRRRSRATPGQPTAVVIGLLLAGLGVLPQHLLPMDLALFPEDGVHEWDWAQHFWTVLVICSVLALVAATSPSLRPPITRGRRHLVAGSK